MKNNKKIILNDRYIKLNFGRWYDLKLEKHFHHNQYKDTKYGKDFNYLDDKKDYLNGQHGILKLKKFLRRVNIPLETSNLQANDEIIIDFLKTNPISFKNKTVLILGGGPSTNLVNWKKIKFDTLIACNNFIKNKDILRAQPSLISFAPFVDLTDKNQDLHQYIKDTNCIITFEPEHIKKPEEEQLKTFYKEYLNRIFIFQTRYCSCLGIGARQIILSILLGAKKIYFTGIDLYNDYETLQHAYEKSKSMPRWRLMYGKDLQDRQVIIFFDYIKQLREIYNFEIVNLSQHLDCNKSVSFVTKEML